MEVTFENVGQIPHDFTLRNSEGVSRRVHVVAQGKGTRTATFTIEAPGTYTFVCDQRHAQAGMQGTILAQ